MLNAEFDFLRERKAKSDIIGKLKLRKRERWWRTWWTKVDARIMPRIVVFMIGGNYRKPQTGNKCWWPGILQMTYRWFTEKWWIYKDTPGYKSLPPNTSRVLSPPGHTHHLTIVRWYRQVWLRF